MEADAPDAGDCLKSGSYRSTAVNADAVIVDAERVQPVALAVRLISVHDRNYWDNDLEGNPLSSSGAASGRLVGTSQPPEKRGPSDVPPAYSKQCQG